MKGSWNTHILGSFAWIIPDPRNPDRAFAHGNAKHHKTDDGGNTWHPSNDFFCGVQFAGGNYEQMFDPKNPDRFCYFTVDEYVCYTETRDNGFITGRRIKRRWIFSTQHVTAGQCILMLRRELFLQASDG